MAAVCLLGCASKAPAPAKDVTYRLVQPACSKCNLDQLAAERVARSAVDCGSSTGPGDDGPVLACIAQAQASASAFRAAADWSRPGREVRSVFLGSAGGEKLELRFDSGLGGGRLVCSGSVTEKTCSAITAGPGGGRLTCTGPATVQSLCDETGFTRKELTPERPVRELTCQGDLMKHGGETVAWVACRRDTAGPPAALEQSVVCSALLRDPQELICFERTGWEADENLGSLR